MMATARLERSVYVIPATSWSMIVEATQCAADLVVIDLDDLVLPDHKLSARANVVRALRDLPWASRACAFRMNAVSTSLAYRDLIEVVEAVGQQLSLVVVPKVDHPDHVTFVDALLTQIENHIGLARPLGLEVQIETAQGMTHIEAIAAASPRIESLAFGPGDYFASVHLPYGSALASPDGDLRSKDAVESHWAWHYAMHRILVAARANGVRAIDGPYADIEAPVGFIKSCQAARQHGFDGKWCIHLSQIEAANRIFVPDEAQIRHAKAVLAAYEAHHQADHGLVLLDGKMIDAAAFKGAQATLEQARLAGLISGPVAAGELNPHD